MMTNIRELYSNFVVKIQEGVCTIGSKKRIEIMLEYVDIRPGDILLDVSGNTGKITEALPEIAKKLLSWSQNTAL